VVERLPTNKVVHVKQLEAATKASAARPGKRAGHRRGVRSHAAGIVGHGSHIGPSSEKCGKKRIVFGSGRIDNETDDGVAVCIGRLVHNMELGTEKAAIDGVFGAGVDVKLQSLVNSINTRDLERVKSAGSVRGVGDLGTVVGKAKVEVGYEARSGLRSCKDEENNVSVFMQE
jgi:hypothetical protein